MQTRSSHCNNRKMPWEKNTATETVLINYHVYKQTHNKPISQFIFAGWRLTSAPKMAWPHSFRKSNQLPATGSSQQWLLIVRLNKITLVSQHVGWSLLLKITAAEAVPLANSIIGLIHPFIMLTVRFFFTLQFGRSGKKKWFSLLLYFIKLRLYPSLYSILLISFILFIPISPAGGCEANWQSCVSLQFTLSPPSLGLLAYPTHPPSSSRLLQDN